MASDKLRLIIKQLINVSLSSENQNSEIKIKKMSKIPFSVLAQWTLLLLAW